MFDWNYIYIGTIQIKLWGKVPSIKFAQIYQGPKTPMITPNAIIFTEILPFIIQQKSYNYSYINVQCNFLTKPASCFFAHDFPQSLTTSFPFLAITTNYLCYIVLKICINTFISYFGNNLLAFSMFLSAISNILKKSIKYIK